MENYKVTEADCIGELQGFPVEVVQKMLERQTAYCGKMDVSAFQCDCAEKTRGFDWKASPEGWDFWYDVIREKRWDLFFAIYPSEGGTVKVRAAKPLRKRNIHLNREQKWCLERILLHEGNMLRKIDAIICHPIDRNPYFNFPLFQGELDEAYEIFCLREVDADCRYSYLLSRICDTLKTLPLLMGYDLSTIIVHSRHYDNKRAVVHWIRKNSKALRRNQRVRFYGERTSTVVDFYGLTDTIPLDFIFDKEYGCLRSRNKILVGNIICTIK